MQSLRDADLKRLGRIHSVADAKAAIAIATRTFDRVSFDLIYARPDQTLDGWRDELTEALALAAGHLSLYQLTIEPETRFADLYAKGRLVIPAAEAAHDLYELTQDLTQAAGLAHYEISNHAQARRGEPAQSSLLALRRVRRRRPGRARADRERRRPSRDHDRAQSRTLARERRAARPRHRRHGRLLTPSARADEMLLMGLRLDEGVNLDRLATVGGSTPQHCDSWPNSPRRA